MITPKDVSEVGFFLSFTKPPPILGFLPSNTSHNKIMHPSATGLELSPKLYGVSLLNNPDLAFARKEITKVATIKKLPDWADKATTK